MLLNFLNGIVQKQSITPFLIKTGNGITLNIVTVPLILSFSHGQSNYLTIHPDIIKTAWKGPFQRDKDSYLYVDIDKNTAKISYGATHLKPLAGGKLPLHGEIGQHYFDFKSKKMYVKRSGVNSWQNVVRVFVGEFRKGAILKCYDVGSNFNLATKNQSGLILFDQNRKPIMKDNSDEFLTTESELSVENSYIGKIDQHLNIVKTLQTIPEHYCVTIDNKNDRYCKIAKNGSRCIGITQNSHAPGDTANYTKYGYLYNVLGWKFSGIAGQPLFVGEYGEISEKPSRYIIQRIGFIVDNYTIFVDIGEPVKCFFDIEVTPSVTPTISPTPTMTPTRTPTVTPSNSVAVSPSPTRTPTATPSITPTVTRTQSVTPTNSLIPSMSPTPTGTPSVTPSISVTPTVTPSITVTPTVTPSITPSTPEVLPIALSIVQTNTSAQYGYGANKVPFVVAYDVCNVSPETITYGNVEGELTTHNDFGCGFSYTYDGNSCAIIDVTNGSNPVIQTYPFSLTLETGVPDAPEYGPTMVLDISNLPQFSEVGTIGGLIARMSVTTNIGVINWVFVYNACI